MAQISTGNSHDPRKLRFPETSPQRLAVDFLQLQLPDSLDGNIRYGIFAALAGAALLAGLPDAASVAQVHHRIR